MAAGTWNNLMYGVFMLIVGILLVYLFYRVRKMDASIATAVSQSQAANAAVQLQQQHEPQERHECYCNRDTVSTEVRRALNNTDTINKLRFKMYDLEEADLHTVMREKMGVVITSPAPPPSGQIVEIDDEVDDEISELAQDKSDDDIEVPDVPQELQESENPQKAVHWDDLDIDMDMLKNVAEEAFVSSPTEIDA